MSRYGFGCLTPAPGWEAGGMPRFGVGSVVSQVAWEACPHLSASSASSPHVQAQPVSEFQYKKLTSCYDKCCEWVQRSWK